MSKLSKLQGTSCQIEYVGIKDDDKKRHRSRCVYYRGNSDITCSKYVHSCIGSAHCKYYEEPQLKDPEEKKYLKGKAKGKQQDITVCKDKPAMKKDWNNNFPIGCTIQHKEYGTGKVTDIYGDNIVVEFDSCGAKKINAPYCHQNRIVKRTN